MIIYYIVFICVAHGIYTAMAHNFAVIACIVFPHISRRKGQYSFAAEYAGILVKGVYAFIEEMLSMLQPSLPTIWRATA